MASTPGSEGQVRGSAYCQRGTVRGGSQERGHRIVAVSQGRPNRVDRASQTINDILFSLQYQVLGCTLSIDED